jgi:hypothetical protein
MTRDHYRQDKGAFDTLLYLPLRSGTAPHSHSIVLGDGNALISQRKFFMRIAKNRLANPSEFRALEFK